ncbi:hypothetical protein [Comamonas sp. GB3 AK4-5]|uniref:hypothetical protein n=1 Tax=Comamonas sp. GB3 AK4-5 TaxID=3231487 RepID=UPI00351EF172
MKTMTHAQALKKLAADTQVQALDEDIARLVAWAMLGNKKDPVDPTRVLPPLLQRWNCVLQAGDAVASALYRHKTAVALAILLHKYGIQDQAINARAEAGMDALNQAVALDDDFFRKTEAIKTAFLQTPPAPLKRSPAMPDHLSFYRAGDVVSLQVGAAFHVLYVHRCARTNESPVIEFYETVFDHVPTMQELEGARARGQRYNDGRERISKYSVSGMKFMPDPAAQLVLVKACVETGPDNRHLEPGVGLYTVSDIFRVQQGLGATPWPIL